MSKTTARNAQEIKIEGLASLTYADQARAKLIIESAVRHLADSAQHIKTVYLDGPSKIKHNYKLCIAVEPGQSRPVTYTLKHLGFTSLEKYNSQFAAMYLPKSEDLSKTCAVFLSRNSFNSPSYLADYRCRPSEPVSATVRAAKRK